MKLETFGKSGARISAVGYVRCSTEMQEDSPDQQKKEILAFAERNGYDIIDWYVDFGKSGTTFDQRPEFERLRKTVENGHVFHAVICYDESRWGRAIDSRENSYWKVHFQKRGVEVLLVKTSIDPKHEYAPMLSSFESIQASQYSKKLSELTLRGAMNNDVYSRGGTAPYGYRRMARNLKKGTIRTLSAGEWCVKQQEKVFWALGDEEEVKTATYIFEQRAKGVACVLIAKALNEGSVPCAKRGKWKNYNRKWSSGTIKSLIENPVYYGARVYNRYSTSKIIAQRRERQLKPGVQWPAWRNPEEEWVIVEKAHQAIVSKDLWEKANAANRHRSPRKPNGHTYHSRYLLTGLIHCSKCGFAFQGWSGTVRGKTYLRYIDGGWQSKRVCQFLSIPRDQMERFAVQAVKETLTDPELVRCIEDQVRRLLEESFETSASEVHALRQALRDNEQRTTNLIRLIEEGNVPGDSIKNRLHELHEEKTKLEGLLARTDVNTMTLSVPEIESAVADFLLNFEERFERAPIEERKLLIQKCISRIVVDRDNRLARFYVRRIPAVTPAIEEKYSQKATTSKEPIMSNRSARNRS